MRKRFSIFLVVLLVAVVASSDWPLSFLSSFWSSHQIISGLIADFLMILLTAAVIERLLSRRSTRIKNGVLRIARDDLVGQYNISRRLLIQLAGCVSFDDRAARPLSQASSAELKEILDSNFSSIYCNRLDEIPERLNVLFYDPDWLRLVNGELQRRQVDWRFVLSRWADAMLSESGLDEILLTAAEYNRATNKLQVPVLKQLRDGNQGDDLRRNLVDTWVALVNEYSTQMDNLSDHAMLNRKYDFGIADVEPTGQ